MARPSICLVNGLNRKHCCDYYQIRVAIRKIGLLYSAMLLEAIRGRDWLQKSNRHVKAAKSGNCIAMTKTLDRLPLGTLVMIALTLGLAPFVPEPHVWQKLKMLVAGTLTRPVDIFDMLFHGVPWLLLIAKLGRQASLSRG